MLNGLYAEKIHSKQEEWYLRAQDGYHGMGIIPKMIEEHKEQWDKIKTIVE